MFAALAVMIALAQAPAADAPPLPISGTNALGGRVFRVGLGLRFDSIAASLRPGDEVVLDRGIHESFTLSDLRGERGKPIVIRGEPGDEPMRFPYIKGGADGIHLVRPRNVVVRDLMVGNATGALLTIDGESDPAKAPWDANVTVSNLRLQQTNAEPEQVAIRLRGVARVDMSGLHIKGWNAAAAVFERASQCSMNGTVLECERALPQTDGVRVLAGSSQVALGALTFGPGVGTAFRLGDCKGAAPDARPASRLLVRRCSVVEPQRFAWLGSVEEAYIDCNTVDGPRRTLFTCDEACGPATAITLAGNLFQWMPGSMDRLFEMPTGAAPENVRLMANLWWSAELPGAFEAIGRPFGIELQPQVVDVDPRLDPKTTEPAAEAAKPFGWRTQAFRAPPPSSALPKAPRPANPPSAPADGTPAPAPAQP